MFTIIIQEKGGEQRRMVFNKPEVTIGRVQGNDIVLPKGNVSKRHARIVLKDGKFIIVDLKSTNGTYVNGRKITSPLVVKDSDKIYIGDFIVGVDEAAAEGDGPSETTTAPPERAMDPRPPAPTQAAPQPMPIPMGGPMGGMGSGPLGGDRGMNDRTGMDRGGGMDRSMGAPPEPPPPPAVPTMPPPMSARPAAGGPPRPPGARDLGGPLGGPPREPPAPREPMAPRDLPPVSAPGELGGGPGPRTRPPGPTSGPRPGGTMPPPMAPIPSPGGGPATLPPPMEMGGAMPSANQREVPPMSSPSPLSMPSPRDVAPPSSLGAGSQPAPVVPLKDNGRSRAPAAAIAAVAPMAPKKVTGRPIAAAAKRGVQLEPLDSKIVKMLDLQSNILERLRAKLDLDRVPMERLHEEDLWQRAEKATIDLVETLETSGELPKYIDQEALIKETLNEALALGPLEDLFADESIDEIVIDRRDRVVVGKNGVLRGSGKAFSSDEMFERVVKRLVHEAGSVIDETRPIVDMRMRDGTRLTAAVAPVAARGACLVLKKPTTQSQTLQDLVAQGALSSGMSDFLTTCITARRNVLVCGGPGAGKTALVAALAAAAPSGERIVSVEEVAELAIGRDEWVQLETKLAIGKGHDVDMATLLDTAIRLMPDRLVVGDVRGREAMALVSALSSSVDGAIVGMSGDGANAALNRIAMLARVTQPVGSDGPLRELVATAFEIVVHVIRGVDGHLKVHSIEEVTGVTESTYETDVVFSMNQGGGFAASGKVPRFYSELGADQAVFR